MKNLRLKLKFLTLFVLFAMMIGCQNDNLLESGVDGKITSLEKEFTSEEAIVLRQDPDVVLRLVGVQFLTGKATLRQESYTPLNKLQTVFENFSGSTYTIEVHTDSRGSSAYNQKLSQSRADAVREYCLKALNADNSLIDAIGYGETRPIDTNRTAAGRARNRRIDFIIHLDPES